MSTKIFFFFLFGCVFCSLLIMPAIAEYYEQYRDLGRYYVLLDGTAIRDKRSTGAIYPNLFAVVRTDEYYDEMYIQTEDENTGCNLEKMFRETVFVEHGFDVRAYAHALMIAHKSDNCEGVHSQSEKKLCLRYQQTAACPSTDQVSPLILMANTSDNPHASVDNFSCEEARETLINDNHVPKQSTEWTKIRKDLIRKKKEAYGRQIAANPPRDQIISNLKEYNPNPSERDIQFATKDWIYEQTQAYMPTVSDNEIQPIVQARYTPSAAMASIDRFSAENGGSCARMRGQKHANKMYGESTNIPPHLILLFADYVDLDNQCICK